MKNILEVTNLKKKFGNFTAVNNVNFSLNEKKTIGLLGPNGCGKTTTIAMLLGLITPTSGSIKIDNEDLNPRDHQFLSKMNFASPYVELPKKLTVMQNLKVYAMMYEIKDPLKKIEELIEKLKLQSLIFKKTGELSSGQRNRISLAKSLINDPQILLLDEPTASLDPDTGDFIRTFIEDYQKNNPISILLASHNMNEVKRLCDHILMMKEGSIIDQGTADQLISKHGRNNLEEVFLKIARKKMKIKRILSLMLRHFYLIKGSFPRIFDLIYWPTVQIILWGFVSKFFTMYSSYFGNAVGVILTAAILYDFLFRSSISYNMLFLEEIWSRNLINLFVSPLRSSEVICALTSTALLRTLLGLVPAVFIAMPLFNISIFELGFPLYLLLLSLYMFGITLGLLVTAGLIRFGPSFENVAWASLFFIAPLGCIYYPVDILPEWIKPLALSFPLAHIFEEMRSILVNNTVNFKNILIALGLNIFYIGLGIAVFYKAFKSAKNRGTLVNIGE